MTWPHMYHLINSHNSMRRRSDELITPTSESHWGRHRESGHGREYQKPAHLHLTPTSCVQCLSRTGRESLFIRLKYRLQEGRGQNTTEMKGIQNLSLEIFCVNNEYSNELNSI